MPGEQDMREIFDNSVGRFAVGLVALIIVGTVSIGLMGRVLGDDSGSNEPTVLPRPEGPLAPAYVPPPQPGRERWQLPHLWQRRPTFPYLPGEDHDKSRSIGGVVHGHLVNSVEIPQPHPALTFLDVQYQRRLFFTTDRMKKLVESAAEHVQEHYPGAVLRLGNFGNPGGGDIPYSVSHNSGRDADLGFYLEDSEGNPAVPDDLVPLDSRGRYESDEKTYVFDTERNWRLIEGLIESGGDQLQYIFVSNPLRRKLIRRARKVDSSNKVVSRAKRLLHQPYGSLPHNDHFHIRIYCSEIDVRSGCEDVGKKHPWYEGHARAKREALRAAREALEADAAGTRVAAARRLALLDDLASAPALREALEDPTPQVRAAAARALGTLDTGTTYLLERLQREEAPQAYLEVVDALSRVGGRRSVRALTEQLGEPRTLTLPGGFRVDARTYVAEALIRLEDRHPVERLVELLDEEAADVRVASARALRYLTNHEFGGRWASRQSSEWKPALEEWRQWLSEHDGASRDAWLRDGFQEAGFDVDRLNARNVWGLCRAVKAEDYLSYNAQRVLMDISGRQPASLSWPKDDANFYWRRWFERRWRRLGAPPIPDELSTLD